MALTNEVKVEIGRILESDEGVNVRIHKLFKLFLDNALARHETVPPSLVLCHPSNRRGAMLNGHDVLAKGELLNKQGVRLDLLEASSVAFSMSKHPEKRKSPGGCGTRAWRATTRTYLHPQAVQKDTCR